MKHLPIIAFAIGCPAGVAPELTARMLCDQEVLNAATFHVFGDKRVLDYGAKIAGVTVDYSRFTFHASGVLDPNDIPKQEISLKAGQFSVQNFKDAIAFGKSGKANVVAFSPFNKASMRLAHPSYEDEVVFLNEMLNFKGKASEFNILPHLWNARVTSHVPLKRVAEFITVENIVKSLQLTDEAMRASGFKNPRIAVAALNPHAGDGGNFGSEEIDIIDPAVQHAIKIGIDCKGSYPSDTVFVRANKGEFDAVLTMYHDQGQIAIKLLGFEKGVTMLGGYPFPIVTCAYGSAYDIAGKGIANGGALKHALLLGARVSNH